MLESACRPAKIELPVEIAGYVIHVNVPEADCRVESVAGDEMLEENPFECTVLTRLYPRPGGVAVRREIGSKDIGARGGER